MADSNSQSNSNSGGSSLLGGILNIISETALGAATKGESVAHEQEAKKQAEIQNQQVSRSAVLNLMGSLAEKGINPKDLGIDLSKLGLDPNSSQFISTLLDKSAQQVQQQNTAEGAVLSKMDPSLAPLGAIPGMTEKLLPEVIKNQQQTALENKKETFTHDENTRKIQSTEQVAGKRIASAEHIADERIGAAEHIANMNNRVKMFIAEHKGGGSITAGQMNSYVKDMAKQFDTMVHGNGSEHPALTGDDLNEGLRSLRDMQLNSGVPISHLWDTLPFSVPVKSSHWTGGTTTTETPAMGLMNAFTVAIPDPAAQKAFQQLALNPKIGPLKAAQAMAQAGKLDKDTLSAILQQIQEDIQNAHNTTPGMVAPDAEAADSNNLLNDDDNDSSDD